MDQERNVVSGEGELDWKRDVTELRLASGEVLELPTNVLRLYRSGRVHEGVGGEVRLRREPMRAQQPVAEGAAVSTSGGGQLVPVIEEELEVGKRTVESGRVRLRKETSAEEISVNVPVASTTYEVERVAKDEVLEEWPEIRREGNTTVYPVVEEDVVLTKRLVLREEIRVTERRAQSTERKSVELRREDVVVEREGEAGPGPEGVV